MPQLAAPIISRNAHLLMWHLTETTKELKSFCRHKIPDYIHHTNRQLEWLAVRIMMQRHFTNHEELVIDYHVNGKPFLIPSIAHVSVSHSGDYVGLLIHPDKAVGLDIEVMNDRIKRITHKFVNEEERQWLGAEPVAIEKLYLIWSAKEAVFKLRGGGIDFKKHLNVMDPGLREEGSTVLFFDKEMERMEYTIHYHYLDGILLVYSIAEN